MSGVNERSQVDDMRDQRLLEATKVIPWEADAQTWMFTYIGSQAKSLLGYPPEQWYEKDFWVSHIHPEDRDSAIRFCEASSKSLTDFKFEYRMIAADGRTVWLNDVVNVVTKNGAPQVLRGFMQDITERKEVEAALCRSREKLIKAEKIARMQLGAVLKYSLTNYVFHGCGSAHFWRYDGPDSVFVPYGPRLRILHRDCLYDGVMQQNRVTRLVQICDTTYRLRPIDIVLFIVSRDKYCRNIST